MGEMSFYIQASNLRRWTPAAIECYERHCICSGCNIFNGIYQDKCCMKSYVLALYRKFGDPKKFKEQ